MTYFEVKCRYEMCNGGTVYRQKLESYLVDRPTFGSAEEVVMSRLVELGGLTRNADITAIRRVDYEDVVIVEPQAEVILYFNAKVRLEYDINEGIGGKKASIIQSFLIGAENIDKANEKVKELFKTSVYDWQVVSIKQTPIIDIINK